MAIDCNLKIDGVAGESTHKDHAGEIEVLEWKWGVEQPSAAGIGGGAGKGKAVPGSLSWSHAYDKASPVLAKSCASGKHFPTAILTVRKAGEGQQDFLKVTAKNVLVKAVTPAANGGGDVIERVSMDYDDIEFEYKEQKPDGSLGGSVKFGWNIKETVTR
jgi:type VI secretion system secreted protein Hcp